MIKTPIINDENIKKRDQLLSKILDVKHVDITKGKKRENLDPEILLFLLLEKTTNVLNNDLSSAMGVATELLNEYEGGQQSIANINKEIKNLKVPPKGASPAQMRAYNNKLDAIQMKLNMLQAGQQMKKEKLQMYWQTNIGTTNSALNAAISQSTQELRNFEATIQQTTNMR